MEQNTENPIAVRENWLNAFIEGARPVFADAGYPLPINLRVSIGLPLAGYRSKKLGEICFPEQSEDGHFEVYINPKTTGGEVVIAEILTRLLMYAATASMSHRGAFKTLAKSLGMTGPLQDCTGGELWFAWASPVIASIGTIDFAPMSEMKPRKVQNTWGIKVECPSCGWLARVSAKHITAHDYLTCPAPDCGSIMETGLDEQTDA